VNALRINERYPGIHGIGFAKYIPSSQLAVHTEEVRAEGFPSYKVQELCKLEFRGPVNQYSRFEHSQPAELPAELPEPEDLLTDIMTLKNWREEYMECFLPTAAG
jgi:hypothetical protein